MGERDRRGIVVGDALGVEAERLEMISQRGDAVGLAPKRPSSVVSTLIATGLDGGDASIAVAEEVEPEPVASDFEVPIATQKSETLKVESTIEEEHEMSQDTRILEPVPAEDEIRITARDWMEEVEEDAAMPAAESTLDFPAVEGDVEHRERIDTPRVRHLFPVPEDADWEVRELKYDHYGRSAS